MVYKKRKGMKVEIYDAQFEKKLGIGTYIGSRRIGLQGLKYWIPRFKLGRKIIYGYECWWIPVSKTKGGEK